MNDQIDITGVGSELQGVGRLPDGRAVFVPGAIPGERVEKIALFDLEEDVILEALFALRGQSEAGDGVLPQRVLRGRRGGRSARARSRAVPYAPRSRQRIETTW